MKSVIPANAGIETATAQRACWIPACAGMTQSEVPYVDGIFVTESHE
jgi:hypothetical protein